MALRIAGRVPAMFLLFSIALLPAAARADLSAGIHKVTSIEGITEYKLDNGLKALLFPDPSKPTVTVNMTVLVGSRQEGYGEAGMAHLLEHMLFKGTPSFPSPKAIPSALEKRGAGEHYNASTDVDRTNFHETLPAVGDNLEFAIRLEADRLMNSFVRAADLKSEMTVVRSEFESGENDPEYILRQRMIAAAYEWHNYGKSTIGNRADIERVPIQNLQEFYHRYYQPDNVVLIVAGKFEPSQALELIAKYFGRIPRPTRKLNTTYTEEPPQDGEHIVRLRRTGDVAVVGVLYHVPAGGEAEFPAVEVLEGILTDEPSGRLYKALVETKQAAQVEGETRSLHDPGTMLLMARVNQGHNPEQVLKNMLATIHEVALHGVTPEEVERIKKQILKRREMEATNTARVALELGEYASQGDWRLYFLCRDRIEKLTADDVSKAAAKYLKPDNSTLGLFLPTKAPDRTTVPELENLQASIGNYKGRQDIRMGESFDPTPANIDARTRIETLPSGIKAALLEKKTRGGEVRLRLTLHYGDLQSLEGKQTTAHLLPELMTRGTKGLSYQQIQDELDKLKGRLSASGNPGDATFSIETRRESLPSAIALLGQILREPAFPENELEIMKRAELAQLQDGLSEPGALAFNAVRRHLAPYKKGDPRYVATLPESMEMLKAVSAADVRSLYASGIGGTHGELVVVGDFDAAQIVPKINAILSDWKAEQPYARISRSVESASSGGSERFITPDKANAMYVAGLVFPMRDDDPAFAPLTLGDYVLGESTLSSRLGDRIRQKEGLSYGVQSTLNASAEDKRAALSIIAICNPVNMQKLEKGVAEEVERLLAKGIPEEELAAAKQGYQQAQQLERTRDGGLVVMLAENLRVDRTMKYYAELEKRIGELTSDEVTAAMRQHIDPKRFYIVTAGDFKRTETASGK